MVGVGRDTFGGARLRPPGTPRPPPGGPPSGLEGTTRICDVVMIGPGNYKIKLQEPNPPFDTHEEHITDAELGAYVDVTDAETLLGVSVPEYVKIALGRLTAWGHF